MKNKNPHNKKIMAEVEAWRNEKALNPPKSIKEITLIKDAYIKHIEEKYGCLIMKNEWEFVKADGKLVDCLLKCNGINAEGENIEFFTGINTIMDCNKNK